MNDCSGSVENRRPMHPLFKSTCCIGTLPIMREFLILPMICAFSSLILFASKHMTPRGKDEQHPPLAFLSSLVISPKYALFYRLGLQNSKNGTIKLVLFSMLGSRINSLSKRKKKKNRGIETIKIKNNQFLGRPLHAKYY